MAAMKAVFDPHVLAGKFIVLDGPDGCGKSTQMEKLAATIQAAGLTVVRLREPGGTSIGEQIRQILLACKNDEMDLRCEMLLYMAARAQMVQEMVKPALAKGEVVLSDRFASSTFAYQGGGGGMDFTAIDNVAQVAVDGTWPSLTIILDITTEAAQARLNPTIKRGKTTIQQVGLFHDRIEQRDMDYHRRVRQGYLQLLQRWPDFYRKVDASGTIDQTYSQIGEVLGTHFG
jgi:dTMP kinase